VVLAASHLDGLLGGLRPEDARGSAHIFFVANAELAMIVEAPRKEHALVIAVKRGVSSAPDVGGSFGANLLDLTRLDIRRARFQHAPNFATLWIAPGPHLAVVG